MFIVVGFLLLTNSCANPNLSGRPEVYAHLNRVYSLSRAVFVTGHPHGDGFTLLAYADKSVEDESDGRGPEYLRPHVGKGQEPHITGYLPIGTQIELLDCTLNPECGICRSRAVIRNGPLNGSEIIIYDVFYLVSPEYKALEFRADVFVSPKK
jgi:hypothetical protein